MNNVRVCSLCKRVYVYDEFENNGYEDVCNHCKPIDRRIKSDLMDDYMELITLKDWAKAHGIQPQTARQRAGRGAFKTARKLGRDWFIDKNEELVDHRYKKN